MAGVFSLDSFSNAKLSSSERISKLLDDAWQAGFKDGTLAAKDKEMHILSSRISDLQTDLRSVDERRGTILKNEILTITPALLAIVNLFSVKNNADAILKLAHDEIEKILFDQGSAEATIYCSEALAGDLGRIIEGLNCTNIFVGESENVAGIEIRTLNGRIDIGLDRIIEACRCIIIEADVHGKNG